MRNALLVVGVIVASFFGGAAFNGPGQDLLRSWLREEPTATPGHRLPMAGAEVGLDLDALAAAAAEAQVSPKSRPAPSAETEVSTEAVPGSGVAPASRPLLASVTDPFPAAPLPRIGEPPSVATSEAPPLQPPRVQTTIDRDPGDQTRNAREDEAHRNVSGPPAPPVPEVVPAPPAPTSPSGKPPLPKLEPTPDSAIAGSTPPSRDSARATVDSEVVPAGNVSSTTASTGDDWRAKLAEAGVTRYWIEGEPNGRVRLRCVIPLAGETAVGQQFEAEAPDEPRAATLILRRVALWQASRSGDAP